MSLPAPHIVAEPEPGELFYDGYLRSSQAYPIIWQALAAARIYVLDRRAVRVVLDAAQRMRDESLPIPELPVLPLWLEFEGSVLQSEDKVFLALLFT